MLRLDFLQQVLLQLALQRLEVGEGIEKKQEDFAAEVAAAQAASAGK